MILQSLEMNDARMREEGRMDSTNHQPSEREVHRVQANRQEVVGERFSRSQREGQR